MKKEILNKAKELMEMLLEEEKEGNVRLSDIPVGGKFDTGIGRFIVLEQVEGKTAVITEDLYREDVEFDDDSNKYITSKLCNLFKEEICPEFKKEFGEENLCDEPVSLTTVDMQNKEEEMCVKVRPLTFDEARKYNELLVNEDLGDWYWTCTAWSTEERNWPYSVAVVSPFGNICLNVYNDSRGVRPFCILKSNIFVSKVEED